MEAFTAPQITNANNIATLAIDFSSSDIAIDAKRPSPVVKTKQISNNVLMEKNIPDAYLEYFDSSSLISFFFGLNMKDGGSS